MKKQISLIISGLLFVGVAFSQSSVWEVSKNGNTLYLGGSVHILRAEDFPLPSEFDKAFKKSEIFVLEVDIAQIQNPEVAQNIMTKAILQGEETLQTVLDEETFKLLETKCTELSLPLENLMKVKPAMLANMLTIVKMQQLGFALQGVDTYYYSKAKERNRKMDFLETIDFQIDLMVNMGDGFENEFVKYTLDDLDNIQTAMENLIPDWRNGTSEYISLIRTEMEETFPTVYKSMLLYRENAWLIKLEKYLTDKPVEFVVVGAAHLQGEEGLLVALKNKGYTVKQVK
jgi:uncharacterized protein YbaP (TraB family)